jgi:hypothetical protein
VDLGTDRVDDLAFSEPREAFLTCGAGRPTEVWAADAPSRKPKQTLSDGAMTAIAFCRSDVLVLGGDGRVVLFDPYLRRVESMRVAGVVRAFASHPERRVLLAAAEGGEGAGEAFFARITLRQYVVRLVQHDVRYRLPFPPLGAAFSADGRGFAVLGAGPVVETVAFPPLRRRALRAAPPASQPADDAGAPIAREIARDPSGAGFWVGDGRGRLLRLDEGEASVDAEVAVHDGPLTGLEARPSRRLVATAGADGWVKLWLTPDAVRRRPPVDDQSRHPITDEFCAWHPQWGGGELESMRRLGG